MKSVHHVLLSRGLTSQPHHLIDHHGCWASLPVTGSDDHHYIHCTAVSWLAAWLAGCSCCYCYCASPYCCYCYPILDSRLVILLLLLHISTYVYTYTIYTTYLALYSCTYSIKLDRLTTHHTVCTCMCTSTSTTQPFTSLYYVLLCILHIWWYICTVYIYTYIHIYCIYSYFYFYYYYY